MTLYHHYIGIDIGKFHFFVAVHGQKQTRDYENSSEGIADFLTQNEDLLAGSFCVLETTGGYEMNLLYSLCHRKIAVHRADTRKVKNFIKSYGNGAKTDKLDALALAKYGAERHELLSLFEVSSKIHLDLFDLVQRRSDLRQMVIAEKNRFQAPASQIVKSSCQRMIEVIEQQIDEITAQVIQLMNTNPELKKKCDTLKTIPGIGEIVAFELLTLLPELGKLNRRKIASLAGLAPIAKDSGKLKGRRQTGHGRQGVKPILFLAAMAARNSKTELRDFYQRFTDKDKPKMVGLTALMRKILVIANAKIRDLSMA